MVVLVGYATAHGATRGIAERIAGRLQCSGLAVDVRPPNSVQGIGRYAAAVLGSAVHGGKWLPTAAQLIKREANGLRDRPVWLFSVGTIGDEESMFGPWMTKRLRALRKEPPEIARFRSTMGHVEYRNFAGAIAATDWPVTGRLFFRGMGGRYGDHRNWPAIDAWADHIAAQLLSPVVVGAREPLRERSPSGEGQISTRSPSGGTTATHPC